MKQAGPGNRGIEIREAHFPGRAPIDAYGNGGFRFADMSHKGSILCLPDGIRGWKVARLQDLTDDSLEAVFACADIDVFLLGLGHEIRPLASALRARFQSAGIVVDLMSTGAAVRTYNVLLGEQRAVGCGLIAVD